MQLVDPGAERRLVGDQLGPPLRQRHEQVHAEGEVRRGDHADRRAASSWRSASSCACQPVVPITRFVPRAASRRALSGTASAIEKSIATSAAGQSPGRSALSMSTRPATSSPSRAPATRPAVPSGRTRSAAPARRSPRRLDRSRTGGRGEPGVVQPRHRDRQVAVAEDDGDVSPRRGLRHHAQREAVERRRPCGRRTRDRRAGCRRRRRGSPSAARPSPRRTRAAPTRSPRAARSSSIVTDTLTSDVVTTSTGGAVALEDLEDPAQESVRHQHARRGDVDDRDVALAGERRRSAGRSTGGSAVMSVPGASGRRLLRMRTGMSFETAGRIVLGCRTLAPK